jgi:hypothetical protein
MMLQIPVEPIRPGHSHTIALVYPQPFWDAEAMATGRITAHFRATIDGPLLFSADSEAGQIVRSPADRRIEVTLPAATTAAFDSARVVFDFVRTPDDAAARVLPGLYSWPVRKAVTRNG